MVSSTAERRAVANSGGLSIGSQPVACSTTRRRVSLLLPPNQIGGNGFWRGVGIAVTSRAEKCRPW